MSSQQSSNVKDKELTPLQESLLILAALNNQIKWALEAILRKDRIEDESLKFTVSNHIHILLCSFLEEWKKLEALGSDEKIKDSLKITSPAIDRIRRWRGLPKARSALLAHGHRDKDGVAILAWEVFGKYDVPTAYAETILLGNCSLLAVRVVLHRHKPDYQGALNQLNEKKAYIEDKGIETFEEIKIELKKIMGEVSVEMSRVTGVHIDADTLEEVIK